MSDPSTDTEDAEATDVEATDAEAGAAADAAEAPAEPPAPRQPLEMEVHRSGVQPATGGANMYLWGSVVAVGALIGFYVFQQRVAAEREALDAKNHATNAAPGARPVGPEDLEDGVHNTQLRTQRDAGFLVRVPSNLRANWKPAGVNRILHITDGKKPLLAINSGPVYPWITQKDLQPLIQGEWKTGNVEAYGIKLDLSGQAWGLGKNRTPEVVLIDAGRVIRIIAPDWKDPRVKQILASYRTKEGGDWRSIYKRTFKVSQKVAVGPPDPKLVADLELRLKLLGPQLSKYATRVAQMGVERHRAGKLDHLDTLIVRDLLAPAVRAYQRDKRQANKKVPDRYKNKGKGPQANPPKSPH